MDPMVLRLGLTVLAASLGAGYILGWYLSWRWIRWVAALVLVPSAVLALWGLVQGGWTAVMALSVAFVMGLPAGLGGLAGAAVARWQRRGA